MKVRHKHLSNQTGFAIRKEITGLICVKWDDPETILSIDQYAFNLVFIVPYRTARGERSKAYWRAKALAVTRAAGSWR